jgi:hypothetical protein
VLPATAALTFLVALSLLGIGILWRWTRLDAIESIAYGAVFGVVMGSTALVPLASWLGLTVPLVVGLGLASAVAGLILLAHPTRTPRSPGAAVGWIAAGVLAAFVVRWALLCASALTVDASGLRAGHIHIWGDWSQHLGDVTSFAYGDNFPPTHPRFTGHPLSYHYLTSVTVAAMVRLGMSPLAALPLHSFVFLCWLTLALFAFARRLSQDSSSAALATVLFLIGGGLGWWLSVRDALATPHFWQALWADPWNRSVQEAANFRWKDIVFAYLVPQRAVLYGLPIGLLASTLLLEGGRGGGWRPFVIAGIATGLLPLAHLGTMLALALITPFLVLLFPRRGWVAYFALWAALAVPVFLMQQGGGGGALHHIHWKVGWIAKPDPWWWFWLKNLGLFAPWFLWALLDRDTVPRTNARFLWAFMPIFVIANLVVFQPWDWDNTKVFLFWYLAGCVLVAASVVRWGRRGFGGQSRGRDRGRDDALLRRARASRSGAGPRSPRHAHPSGAEAGGGRAREDAASRAVPRRPATQSPGAHAGRPPSGDELHGMDVEPGHRVHATRDRREGHVRAHARWLGGARGLRRGRRGDRPMGARPLPSGRESFCPRLPQDHRPAALRGVRGTAGEVAAPWSCKSLLSPGRVRNYIDPLRQRLESRARDVLDQ